MDIGSLGKNEEGSVAVITAISLTLLIGITSLALDFGRLAADRQKLQNAADASALAAAAELAADRSDEAVTAAAEEYLSVNGFDPAEETVTAQVAADGNSVEVIVSHEVRLGFARVILNRDTSAVSASAKAEAVSIFGGCPYALFAGQRIEEDGSGITITGSSIEINGNIHSNSDISMAHAVLGPGSAATAVRSVNPSTAGWSSGCIAMDMPSMKSFEKGLTGNCRPVEFPGNVVKASEGGLQELIEEALEKYAQREGDEEACPEDALFIHISGNLTFNGKASSAYEAELPFVLIVDGDINMNGTPLDSSSGCPAAIMSKRGNITVNGGGASFTGILYAPQGDVTLNGNEAEYNGSIVARNIRKSGGKITVNYSEDADRCLPVTKVRLIE